uniref:Uncharacterized protein n=1 Tax=Oryza punctata TaxID=4537 RepID=A0A0E0JJY0_ORYPU
MAIGVATFATLTLEKVTFLTDFEMRKRGANLECELCVAGALESDRRDQKPCPCKSFAGCFVTSESSAIPFPAAPNDDTLNIVLPADLAAGAVDAIRHRIAPAINMPTGEKQRRISAQATYHCSYYSSELKNS